MVSGQRFLWSGFVAGSVVFGLIVWVILTSKRKNERAVYERMANERANLKHRDVKIVEFRLVNKGQEDQIKDLKDKVRELE